MYWEDLTEEEFTEAVEFYRNRNREIPSPSDEELSDIIDII